MTSPAGLDHMTGEGRSRPAVRSCLVCNREGIRLPVCATCQRDLGNVVYVSFGRAFDEGGAEK